MIKLIAGNFMYFLLKVKFISHTKI